MAAPSLSPNVARLPQVQEVLRTLERTRARASELRQEARQATTPAMASLSVQGGAALNGAILAYGGRLSPHLILGAGLVGLLAGTVMEEPRLVLVANGVLAPLTATKVLEALTATRSS